MQSNSDSFLTNEHRAKRYLSRQQSPAMQEEDDDQVFWQDNVPDATRQRDTLTGTSTSVTGNRYYVPWTFISHTHQQDIVPGSASSQYIDTSRSQITYLVSGDEDSVAGTYNLQGYISEYQSQEQSYPQQRTVLQPLHGNAQDLSSSHGYDVGYGRDSHVPSPSYGHAVHADNADGYNVSVGSPEIRTRGHSSNADTQRYGDQQSITPASSGDSPSMRSQDLTQSVVCEYCQKTLTGIHAAGNLLRHKYSDECPAPFGRECFCSHCSNRYARSDALLNHMRKKHGVPGPSQRRRMM